MARPGLVGRVLVLACAMGATSLSARQHQHPAGPTERVGTVHFATSCSATAQPKFERALALLHSFEFGQATQGFKDTLSADPSCAIAYWGIALAQWGNPFAPAVRPRTLLDEGLRTIRQAEQTGAKTERERGYIAAASKLFADGATLDQPARISNYEKSMSALAAKYPDDREASIFWTLALAASASPTDKTYANQLRAGAILEKIAAEQPDHPGVVHYIIHAYDVPPLASRALDAARKYATIAPAAPHALHMPSHTFTRVGAWSDSIETNNASVIAAQRLRSVTEELHAMDYMAYAYLQTGQDEAVRQMVTKLPELAVRVAANPPASAAPVLAGYFALAAIPARLALEHRDWTAAARVVPHPSPMPYVDALSHFTRALGAAKTGALADARASIQALEQLRDRLGTAGESYWFEQVDIQRESAAAFLALAEHRDDEAVATMRKAADREDATEKNVVTPGPLLPAREMLGDMLIELKQPAAALVEFQAVMKKEPNRFRAIYGAAKAASLSGDREGARRLYTELLRVSERADRPGRAEIAEARAALR